MIQPLFEYCHALFGTLYGQLDIPWFPVDDIPPVIVPRSSTDPIIQSSDAALYHRAVLLDEIQLVFPLAFPAI
jgi:hypothetical protein